MRNSLCVVPRGSGACSRPWPVRAHDTPGIEPRVLFGTRNLLGVSGKFLQLQRRDFDAAEVSTWSIVRIIYQHHIVRAQSRRQSTSLGAMVKLERRAANRFLKRAVMREFKLLHVIRPEGALILRHRPRNSRTRSNIALARGI